MATFEEELKKIHPVLERLCNFMILGKKIVVKGSENFLREGPNIIVGNHIGTFKDIATIYKIVPRPVFFTANKLIFDKKDFDNLIRKHFHRHLKSFGPFFNLIIGPLKSRLINFVSSNIGKVGTIPVDLSKKKSMALEKCQEYLKEGKAIITLQGWGRVMSSDSNPYVMPFRKGASILTYKLYRKEGISVPVTPVAIFGTHIPFLIPGKIKVNIGEPMHITDYMSDSLLATVNSFRKAMEDRVKALFIELLRE